MYITFVTNRDCRVLLNLLLTEIVMYITSVTNGDCPVCLAAFSTICMRVGRIDRAEERELGFRQLPELK